MTALSIDYFNDPPSLKDYPPKQDRRFVLSEITPFGGRLITEVIGCSSANPKAISKFREQYYPEQYGYNPKNATHKFIRMRVNNGIVPLASQRGGACAGRTDGMCSMEGFLKGSYEAEKLAVYQKACFGNFTLTAAEGTAGTNFDGAPPTKA